MPVISGTSGADTLNGTSGNDTINGLAGNDVINGGQGGTDVVDGGDGRDSLQFMTATSGVVVDFVAGTAGTTSFTSIEKVVTGDFNDRLTGNSEAQNLTARAGMDALAGGGGIDTTPAPGACTTTRTVTVLACRRSETRDAHYARFVRRRLRIGRAGVTMNIPI